MKIIYLHQYFKFPSERGSTRSYDLAVSFLKEGYKVVIISSSKSERFKSKRWNIIQQDGLEVHFIYSPFGTHLSYLKRTFIFFKFMWHATFRLLKINADIVLATSTPLTIGIPPMIKRWVHKTPYVFEVRDVWPEAVIAIGAVKNKWMQRWLYYQEKIIYTFASYIVPLSTDMQKSIIKRFPSFTQKTDTVIENISEISRFQSCDTKPSRIEKVIGMKPRFTILYAGTFGRVNGLSYLVDLAEQTLKLDPSLVYILIGAGGDKAKVTALAEQRNVLQKNLFILDPISKDELPAWYRSVNMGSSFVINIKELWANSANKFFDSLAAGKPVLINHQGWQASIIEKENLGYVLPEMLTSEEVEKFVAYTKNDSLHNRQRQNSYQKAISSYSLEIATRKYINIFSRILK